MRCSMVQCAGRRPRAVSLGPLGQFTFCGHRPLQGAYGTKYRRGGIRWCGVRADAPGRSLLARWANSPSVDIDPYRVHTVYQPYRRRDTQVPPYEIIRNPVPAGSSTAPRSGPSRMPAPTSIIIDGPYQRRDTQVPPYEIIRNPVPAGLRGLWPSHRNNSKHGLRTLPHPLRAAAPNHYTNSQNPNIKSFTRFFSKNRRGPGGSAPDRASQGAKFPLATANETPARRNGRNPLTAESTWSAAARRRETQR